MVFMAFVDIKYDRITNVSCRDYKEYKDTEVRAYFMKRTSINRYSEKKISQIQAESQVRIELCKRAGGTPITQESHLFRNGKKYPYTKVACVGGICECGLPDCPKHPQNGEHLEPHEIKQRSLGGVMSLENSRMVLRQCHRVLQHSEPMWSKDNG